MGARDRSGCDCSRGRERDPARRGRAGAAVHRRRLRRLLLLARARNEPRPDVPTGFRAAVAELAPPAGWLSRPRGHGRRQRDAGAPPARAVKAGGCGRSALRSVAAPRHRARAGFRRRGAEHARRARGGVGLPGARLRRRARQRLERTRHPGLGVRAARPVPRQELRDLDLRLGHAAGTAGGQAGGGARAGPRAVAVPAPRRGLGLRHPPGGRTERNCCLERKQPAASTGRCRSNSRTRRRTAPASGPAT